MKILDKLLELRGGMVLDRKEVASRLDSLKFKGLVGLAALAIASPLTGQIVLREPLVPGVTFHFEEFSPHYLGHSQADVNDDGRMDAIAAGYDFDGNNFAEAKAFYRTRWVNGNNTVNTEENAYFVTVDVDEDGQVDYILLDRDRDGTLESVEIPRVAMEEIKRELYELRD